MNAGLIPGLRALIQIWLRERNNGPGMHLDFEATTRLRKTDSPGCSQSRSHPGAAFRSPGILRKAVSLLLLALFLLIGLSNPAMAQQPGATRAILILVPQASGEQLLQSLSQPEWTALRAQSGVALMSAAVPGPDTPASAYLTLGAGRRVEVPTRAADVYPQGVDALIREPIQHGLGVTLLSPRGSESYARLIGSDFASNALLPDHPVDQLLVAQQLLAENRLVIVEPRSLAEALEFANRLVSRLDPDQDLLVLASLNPDSAPGGQFRHLAPALFWGGSWSQGSARSATTRTPGLISNSDLTPTLLAHLNVPIPGTVEGHPAQPARRSLASLVAFERHVRATGEVTVPVLIGWGVFAFGAVACVLFWIAGAPSSRQVERGRLLLATSAAAPLAMLLAAGPASSSGGQLVAAVLVCEAGLMALVLVLRRRLPPLLTVLAATSGVILADLLTGGGLLARCLLGDFVNTGVRFYGIGNEYEGLILGASLLVPFWLQAALGPELVTFGRSGWRAAILWPVTFAAVAAPALGADFGGALSLGIAYAAGAWLASGRRLRPPQVLAGGLLLMLLALGVVALDLMRPAGARSHVGELAAQVLRGDTGRIADVVGRKLLMNVRMVLTPYSLVGLAAVAALGGICYHRVASRVRDSLASRPLLRAGSGAALLGAAAAFAFNDSGIVAGALAAGCVLLMWLDVLLSDALKRELV